VKDQIVFDAESSFKSLYESISTKGNRQKYINLLKEIRKSDRAEPMYCMAVSLASVLVKKCGVLPFIFHLYGEGGKGKTVSLMWASSLWGDPNEGGFIADAKSTKTAFEMRLNFLNNLPFICDDLGQVKRFMSGQKNGDFSDFIYLVCSGKGNERSNVNLGLNAPTDWKNCSLTSSEKPITSEISQGGELLRVIDFKVEDGNIFKDAKFNADFLRCNYGFLGQEFINVVQKLGFNEVCKIHKEYIKLIEDMDVNKDKEGKQVIPMALILTADKIFTEHIVKDNFYLDISECFSLIKSNKQMSDNERAYEFIINEFNLNKGKFTSPNNDLNERWGYLKDEFILFNPNVFSEIAERGNFNKKMFIAWALKKGLTETNPDRIDKRVNQGNIKGKFIFVKNEN
jgi:uncharacterized protein (DUF927 family)